MMYSYGGHTYTPPTHVIASPIAGLLPPPSPANSGGRPATGPRVVAKSYQVIFIREVDRNLSLTEIRRLLKAQTDGLTRCQFPSSTADRNRGHVTAEYKTYDFAKAALERLQGSHVLGNSPLDVRWASEDTTIRAAPETLSRALPKHRRLPPHAPIANGSTHVTGPSQHRYVR